MAFRRSRRGYRITVVPEHVCRLEGTSPSYGVCLKKKAVVAIGRQLIVDLWRLETGRVTAQELNLVMIDAEGV